MSNLRLFALLLATGAAITGVHDFTYRRVDVADEGDYELGGLLTHAASDMVILTLVMAVVALVWANRARR